MEALTKRQQRVLRTILKFFEDEDRPPTTRELAELLGCHVKTVYQYILVLERKGYIERRKGRIRVAPELREDRGILIVGRVAAGVPAMAIENREGILSLEDLFGMHDVFAVRVTGDSMKDVGILDGDMVIVRSSSTVPAGAIAVCYVGEDQEVTVKRLKERRDCFELIPENPAYRPTRISKGDPHFRLGGKVIGLVRTVSRL